MLQPVNRPAQLSETVAAKLAAWISDAGLAAGDHLPAEKVLAERFGVSRAVIREAFARLKAEGCVETRQGSGAFVSGRPGLTSFRVCGAGSGDSLAQAFELRYLVETGVAELAALRRSRNDVEAMRAALSEMDRALIDGGAGAAADDAFHIAIAAATGNPLTRRFMAFMGQQFSGSRLPTWDADGRAAGLARDAQAEHRRIFEAIAAGDAAAARAASAQHLIQAAHRLGLAPVFASAQDIAGSQNK
jgi:GntR family transcriptional repressor for pyruvate dehydrogenase complex